MRNVPHAALFERNQIKERIVNLATCMQEIMEFDAEAIEEEARGILDNLNHLKKIYASSVKNPRALPNG